MYVDFLVDGPLSGSTQAQVDSPERIKARKAWKRLKRKLSIIIAVGHAIKTRKGFIRKRKKRKDDAAWNAATAKYAALGLPPHILNRGFMFLSPAVCTSKSTEVIKKALHRHGVTIVRHGKISPATVDAKNMFDFQYHKVAACATLLKPENANISAAEFERKTGESHSPVCVCVCVCVCVYFSLLCPFFLSLCV